MKLHTFKEFEINESRDSEEMFEKLMQPGNNRKFGNVLIMAGGGGSGKGFVRNNLIGFDGAVLDVDDVKRWALKAPILGEKIRLSMKSQFMIDQVDMRNPEHLDKLHYLIGKELKLPNVRQSALMTSVMLAPHDRKPNLVFDVTLKDMEKFFSLTESVKDIGYKPENVHLVWVITDVKVALEQNAKRDRVVKEVVLIDAHEGVSRTVQKLMTLSDLRSYLDGDVFYCFNNPGVDVVVTTSANGGKWISKAFYVKVKKQGQEPVQKDQLDKEVTDKILAYVGNTG